MCWNLNNLDISSYTDCMQNKSMTSKPIEPLYPLLVPNNCFDSIDMDFVGLLPKDEGYDMLMIVTDQLGLADIYLVLFHTTNIAPEIAYLFFDNWYCENGLSLEIISD